MEKEYTPKNYLVVMPSIRPINPAYPEALKGFDIFVADDSDGKVDRLYIRDKRYLDDGFKNIILGDSYFREHYVPENKRHLFPRHCPSVKDLGLYFAWKEKYKAVILIDDDVDTRMVQPEDFMVINKDMPVMKYETPSKWFNTLRLLGKEDIYARGYPYEFRGEEYKWSGETSIVKPMFNEGLWIGTPDINGVDKLEMNKDYACPNSTINREREIAQPPIYDDSNMPWYIAPRPIDMNMLIRKHQKLPLSIMNCQIDVSLIPAFWQPPDYQMYRSFKIRRHDDIWSMYFLKKVMDVLEMPVTVGKPVLWHRKAGDPITEILSEHHTNLIQPRLTRNLDENVHWCDIGTPAQTSASLARLCMDDIDEVDNFDVILRSYFASAMEWAELFMV